MPDYLTVNEIAARLDVKPATVRRWLADGHLPGYKVGRRDWRVRRVDFDAYCESKGIEVKGKERKPPITLDEAWEHRDSLDELFGKSSNDTED